MWFGLLRAGAAAPLEGELPDEEGRHLEQDGHVAKLPQSLDHPQVRLSEAPPARVNASAEGRPVRDDANQVEHDARARGVTHLPQVARPLQTQGDAVAE